MILQGDDKRSEVINKLLTRSDVADSKQSDVECSIKIAATLHARMSSAKHIVVRAGTNIENYQEISQQRC